MQSEGMGIVKVTKVVRHAVSEWILHTATISSFGILGLCLLCRMNTIALG